MEKSLYKQMVDICYLLEIDPFKEVSNVTFTFFGAKEGTFDLSTIDFSKESIEEITGIGKIINNLISQERNMHDLGTEEEKRLFETEKSIKAVLPLLKRLQSLLLKKGLAEKGFSKKDLGIKILGGLIIQEDPEKTEKHNKLMEQIHKQNLADDLRRRAGAQQAKNILLD